MSEQIMNSADSLNAIFDDIAADEAAAVKEETEVTVVEEVKEPEEVKEEPEEVKEEPEPEPADEIVSEEKETTSEETEEDKEEVEVDKTELEVKLEAEPQAALFKVKEDGVEREVDKEELVRGYQRAQVSDQRFKDAKQVQKENEVFWTELMQNPGEALTNAVTDKYCNGDRVMARARVVDAMLTWLQPEREISEIQGEQEKILRQREHEIELRQLEFNRKQTQAEVRSERDAEAEFHNSMKAGLTEAFEKNSLPTDQTAIWRKTGKLLEEFVDELPEAVRDDTKVVRAEMLKVTDRVVKQVAKEREEDARSIIPTLSADELERFFPEQSKLLKDAKIERVKKERSKKKPGTVKQKKKEVETKKQELEVSTKMISTDDLFRDME